MFVSSAIYGCCGQIRLTESAKQMSATLTARASTHVSGWRGHDSKREEAVAAETQRTILHRLKRNRSGRGVSAQLKSRSIQGELPRSRENSMRTEICHLPDTKEVRTKQNMEISVDKIGTC